MVKIIIILLCLNLQFTHILYSQWDWEIPSSNPILKDKSLADSLFYRKEYEKANQVFETIFLNKYLSVSEYFNWKTAREAVGMNTPDSIELSYLAAQGILLYDQDNYSDTSFNLYQTKFADFIIQHWSYWHFHKLLQSDQILRIPPYVNLLLECKSTKTLDRNLLIQLINVIETHGIPPYDEAHTCVSTLLQHAIRSKVIEDSEFEFLMAQIYDSSQKGYFDVDTYAYLADCYLVFIKQLPQRFGMVRQYDNRTLFPVQPIKEVNQNRFRIGYYITLQESIQSLNLILPNE